MLNARDGECSPQSVQIFIDALKTYTITNFIPGLDNIFSDVDPKYPEFVMPPLPAPTVVASS